jgi:hypothetical protein
MKQFIALIAPLLSTGCSIKRLAINRVGNALASADGAAARNPAPWPDWRVAGSIPIGRPYGKLLLVFVLIAAFATSVAAAQPNGGLHSRTLSIGGVGRQPKFTLDISAAGRIGTVVVNTDAGAKVQTLTCDLFRDWGAPIGVDQATTESVFNYHDKSFVSGLKTTDLDFDGMPDILAPRDFGAKWVTYCVWHFDPNQGRFIQDALSRQMEDLVNLTVDAERRQIVTFTIGPIDPMRDEYRIDSRSVNQYAQRRLLAVRSCVLDTGRAAGAARTASVVTYLNGQEVVQRRTVSADCNDVCGDGCPSVSGKR